MATKAAAKAVTEEAAAAEKEYTADDWEKEKVPFYAFRDNGRYAGDIIVGVNGRIWRIKRGEQVMIPRYVAEVIQRSNDQDTRTANMIDSLSGSYKEL